MKICKICKKKKPLDQFYSQIIKLTNGPKTFYRTECKKCSCVYHKKYYQNHREKMISDNIKRFNKKRKFTAELTEEQIHKLIHQPCNYCGEDKLIGIDRINSDFGYSHDNIVPCCIRCNALKSDMPIQAWMELAPTVRKIRKLGFFEQWVGHNLGSKRSYLCVTVDHPVLHWTHPIKD